MNHKKRLNLSYNWVIFIQFINHLDDLQAMFRRPKSLLTLFTSPKEEELLNLVAQPNKDSELINLIKDQFTPESLINLCETYPILETELKRESLQKYWLEKFEEMAEQQKFPNKLKYKHNPLHHPYDEVKGFIYFLKVLRSRQKEKKSLDYDRVITQELEWLNKSDAAGWYDAAREVQALNVEKLDHDVSKSELEAMLENAENSAQRHLTPGHILAAEYYILLAGYHAKRFHMKEHERLLMIAMLHLYIAKELESISKIAIHNAYYGESLIDAFEKHYATIMNTIPFESWATFINTIKSYVDLDKRLVNEVEKIATKLADEKKTSLITFSI